MNKEELSWIPPVILYICGFCLGIVIGNGAGYDRGLTASCQNRVTAQHVQWDKDLKKQTTTYDYRCIKAVKF